MTTQSDKTAISPGTRWKVVQRDSIDDYPCCIYCGKPADDFRGRGLEIHHAIPRSLGGMGVEKNLVLLCHDCHEKAQNGDKDANEFIQVYLFYKYGNIEKKEVIWRKRGIVDD